MSIVAGSDPHPVAGASFGPESVAARMSREVLAALQLIACTVAVVVASAAYGPFFADSSFLPPVTGAAVVGTLCGVAVMRLPRPAGVAWGLSVVAFVVFAVYVIFPDRTSSGLPGTRALSAVGDGLLGGLARMLTITPPADVQGELLILPVALAFTASLASAVLTDRRSVLLPVLPPLLVFITALLLSANAPDFHWKITLGFLGCLLLIVLLRANPAAAGDPADGRVAGSADADPAVLRTSPPEPPRQEGTRSLWRTTVGRLLFGLPVVIGVTLLAVTTAGALPVATGAARFDPRAVRQAPLNIQDRLNPLVDVRRQLLKDTPSALFTVRAVDGAPIPFDRVRTAALDTYDGIQWQSSARFVRTGSTLPPGQPLTDPVQLTVDVTFTGAMAPPFLPEFGRPVRIDDAGQVGFDQASGLLATAAPNLEAYSYRLTGEVVSTDIDPATAVPAQGPSVESLTELPQLAGDPAAGLRSLAQQWTTGIVEPYAQLDALASHLRQSVYALDATPGHSFAALDRFLDTAPATVDKRVTEEQTVAAFTIMARSLGYPTRVAVGYRLDPQSIVDGTYTVTTKNADAWAEIAFDGRGWVPFQVTPPRQGDPPAPPPVPQGNGQGPVTPVRPDDSRLAVSPDTGGVGKAISWAVALTVLIPLIVVMAAIAGVALTKQWRRNRRGSVGSASDRIAGAWRESTDRLQEHGMAVTLVRTPQEIGDQATERFGPEAGRSVLTLAPIVSEALYAPDDPGEDAVVQAWDLESELHSILDSQQPWWGRMLFWIDPRPLLRTRPFRRTSSTDAGQTP